MMAFEIFFININLSNCVYFIFLLLFSSKDDTRITLTATRKSTRSTRRKFTPLRLFQLANEGYLAGHDFPVLLLPGLMFELPVVPKHLTASATLTFMKLQFAKLVSTLYWYPAPEVAKPAVFKTPQQLASISLMNFHLCTPLPKYYTCNQPQPIFINKKLCPKPLYAYLTKCYVLYTLLQNVLHHSEQQIANVRLIEVNFHMLFNNFLYHPEGQDNMHRMEWNSIYSNMYYLHRSLTTFLYALRFHYQYYYNFYKFNYTDRPRDLEMDLENCSSTSSSQSSSSINPSFKKVQKLERQVAALKHSLRITVLTNNTDSPNRS
jgi:hypothetical protein